MNRLLLLSLVLVASGGVARSELVEFKNGDQLTGSWLRVNGDKIVFKSDAVGEVSLPVSKVKSMISTTSAVVLVKSGEAYSGRLSLLDSGEWELRGEDGGARRLKASSVLAIYPLQVYQAKGEEAPFRPFHNWQGIANVGYSLVRGDRDASTLSMGVNGTRRFPNLPGFNERFRTNYLLTMLFANTPPTAWGRAPTASRPACGRTTSSRRPTSSLSLASSTTSKPRVLISARRTAAAWAATSFADRGWACNSWVV